MRKKLVALVTVVLILSVALTGCGMFTVNAERDYKQVLVTVDYDGMHGTVTKGEFLEYYAQNYQYYAQYWEPKKIVDEFLVSLAKREILVLEARKYFAEQKGIDKNSDLLAFLNPDELKWVNEQTNKMFDENWDTIVKDLIKDEQANKGEEDNNDDEDENKSNLAPRPTYEEEEESSEFVADPSVTAHEIVDFFKTKENENLSKLEKKGLEKIKKNLIDQFKDYDYFLYNQAESRLLQKFQEANQTVNITEEDLIKKYSVIYDKNTQEYKNSSSYKSALESGNSTIIYHNGQYVKVKSIMLKFSDAQTSMLNSLKALYPDDEQKSILNEYRKVLVTGDGDLPFLNDSKNLGLLVNISNLDYDPDAECKDENCTCPSFKDGKHVENGHIIDRDPSNLNIDGCTCVECAHNAYEKYNVPYLDIIDMIGEEVEAAAQTAESEYASKYPDEDELGKQMYIVQEKIKAFEKLIYKVNDDEGMFGGKEYLETPSGNTSSYVTEYTALVRALLRDNGTSGVMKVNNDTTTYMVNDEEVEIYTNDNTVSYIINDYGVHIVMLTTVPVDKVLNDGKYTVEENTEFEMPVGATTEQIAEMKAANSFYTLSMEAVIKFDKKTGKAMTVKDVLREEIEKAQKSDSYDNYTREYFEKYGDDFFSKENAKNNGVKRNDSVYKQVLNYLNA